MAEFRLETERLLLRDWREADREPFAAINANARVMEHLNGPIGREQSDALIDKLTAYQREHGHCYWALERKSDGALIGFCSFCPGRHPGTPVESEFDLGWRLAQNSWGHGYACEAAAATLAWTWANTDSLRLAAWTVPANARSWGLMIRLGMERRHDLDFDHPAFKPGHELRSHIVYAITRPQ